ncbi:ABC transporter ATP-binding protein [Natronosalvus halobius]|uniref:ABC transporter ATP-binding protein n=1 Tax=Natronosalvus halobius TaxID=2953746 RepID=UPI00209ED585|nr:ABC transporter ATP-binding protein [Natronosalvus halobius]USZ71004.1 ABC transporter ATP-binding protein [Natronosalvus halobius]
MNAIEVTNVTKRFGDVTALNDLSLTVEDGEIFGFLGPNGAGKSTTINLLLDFIRPTDGTVSVLGMDAQAESKAIRQRLGVLPEGFTTYDRLTGRQHLEFAIESKDATEEPDLLFERVGLSPEDGDRKAGGYSKGMSQRLLFAMALVGDPDMLILDEPSTGLDPNGAREMRQLIREENDRGTTIFFSSHILEQVEAVCDRVGIIRNGEMVAVDSVEGLRDSVSTASQLRIETDRITEPALEAVRALEGVERAEALESGSDGAVVAVETTGSKTAVLSALEDAGIVVQDFSTAEASLEDVFQRYTEVTA